MAGRNAETFTGVKADQLARIMYVLFNAVKADQPAGRLLLLSDGRPEAIDALSGRSSLRLPDSFEECAMRVDPFVRKHLPQLDEARLRRFEEQLKIDFVRSEPRLKGEVVGKRLLGTGLPAAAYDVTGKVMVSSLKGVGPISIEAYQIVAKPYARRVETPYGDYGYDPVLIQVVGAGKEIDEVNQLLAVPAQVLTRALSRSEQLTRYLQIRRASPGVGQPAMDREFFNSPDFGLLSDSLEVVAESLMWFIEYLGDNYIDAGEETLAYLLTLLEYTVGCLSGKLLGYHRGLSGLMRDILFDKRLVTSRG